MTIDPTIIATAILSLPGLIGAAVNVKLMRGQGNHEGRIKGLEDGTACRKHCVAMQPGAGA